MAACHQETLWSSQESSSYGSTQAHETPPKPLPPSSGHLSTPALYLPPTHRLLTSFNQSSAPSQLHQETQMWREAGHCADTKQDPVGFLGTKACVPHFLITGNRLHSASMTFPEFQWAVPTVANQGREGMWRQGRNSQETIVQPWGRVLVPPQGRYITISLSCFAETETPTWWEK